MNEMHFAAIGSMRRGAFKPEPLDEAGQAAAFSRLRMDECRSIRVEWECESRRGEELLRAQRRPPASEEVPGRVAKLMKLATMGRRA